MDFVDKNSVLVSISMITYNHENYLAQALEGVLMQKTTFNFEVVIGEDCSTDNTRSILEHYESKYPDVIKPIYQEKNVGAFRNAYEFTLPRCKGKYIACLEGDDYWTDTYKLQKQVDFMETNEDYGLVHTGFDIYNEDKNRLFKKTNITDKRKLSGEIFNCLLLENTIGTLTVLVRRNIFINAVELHSNQTDWLMRDYPLWLEIAYRHKIGYLPESTAVYRERSNTIRQTNNLDFSLLFLKSTFEIKQFFLHRSNAAEEISRQINYDYYSGLLWFAYSLGDKELAKTCKINIDNSNRKWGLRNKINYYCTIYNTLKISRQIIDKFLHRLQIH